MSDSRQRANDRSYEVIGAAIEVHRWLGPGLLESAYEQCLHRELTLRGIPFKHQHWLPIEYKGVTVPQAYRLDFWVDDLVVVELKAVELMELVFEAQLLTYMRLSSSSLGLLINFDVPVLKEGIRRRVLNF